MFTLKQSVMLFHHWPSGSFVHPLPDGELMTIMMSMVMMKSMVMAMRMRMMMAMMIVMMMFLQVVGFWIPWSSGPRAVGGNCFPL